MPAVVGDFVGRNEEAARLQIIVTADRGAPAVVVVTGKPGVGKTALTLHLAHRLSGEFPDGQLFVNLRGAERSSLRPDAVLDRFLRALGVDGAAIPDNVEERAALYRAYLADRRVLVVLDDAADESQVRPLLPAAPGAAVLVTSRMRLTGLEGAATLDLDVLPGADAVELLGRIAGRDRVAADVHAAADLVDHCGALPLAVRVAGARLAARPQWSVPRMAGLLANELHRLDHLVAGDLEVRASLALSYENLDDVHRRTFRLLGLLDVGAFASWLAAPLLDVSVDRAECLVDGLADMSLLDLVGVDAAGSDRYRFHDVVRSYARERALAEEPPDEARQAVLRAGAGWLAVAEEADRRLPETSDVITVGTAARWTVPQELAERLLADPLGWFDTELPNLLAVVDAAAAADAGEAAWETAAQLATYLRIRSDATSLQRAVTAAMAACDNANLRGRAALLAIRGLMFLGERQQLSYGPSQEDLRTALGLFRRLGDRRGQAKVHHGLAEQLRSIAQRRGLAAALTDSHRHAKEALQLAQSLGDPGLEIEALSDIGNVFLDLGRLAEAESVFEQALLLGTRLGARRGCAVEMWRLGQIRRETGRLEDAAAMLEEGLVIVRQLGDGRGEAQILLALADTRAAQGALDLAEALLVVAADVADRIRNSYVHAQVCDALGGLRLQQRRFTEAAELATIAAEAWRTLDAEASRTKSLRLLGEALDALGRTAEADAARQRVGHIRG